MSEVRTVVLRVNPERPEPERIRTAAKIIREGGLVVYPTETVYGLGANARSDEAVARVFRVKVRALEDPIPVAVSSIEMAREVSEIGPTAERLAGRFLPGPLTLILPAKPTISELVTAKTGKVGIRIPDHRVAHELIELFGAPITSTSANLSGKPAPSTAREALEQLGNRVDAVFDSGRCAYARPSTVVDLTLHPPRVLREGPIGTEEIKRVLNR